MGVDYGNIYFMKIRSFELPPVATNAYLLSDAETKQAIVIDTPMGAWDVISPILEAEGLTLQAVLLTHAHFDHVLGAQAFKDAGIPFYLHRKEADHVDKLRDQIDFFQVDVESDGLDINHWIDDEVASFEFLGQPVEARCVSGHSPGNIVFYFPAQGCAFAGDAIFKGSIGRFDLPGGSFKVLRDGIQRQIYSLPNETVLYPGHGDSTSVAVERVSNPYVQG